MTQRSRLILTRDGERAFARLADGIARLLDELLRRERVKKKDLAARAGVDQAVLSRVLDGTRNVEIRTVGALFGALGYALELKAKRLHPSGNVRTNHHNDMTVELSPADSRQTLDSAQPSSSSYDRRALEVSYTSASANV
jgi:transcriptional regulator with XRE-family HTH domain